MADFLKVKLNGEEFLLLGTLEEGGAITTEAEFKKGVVGFAHLYPDGSVRRHGEEIARREQLEVLGTHQVKMTEGESLDAVLNLLRSGEG